MTSAKRAQSAEPKYIDRPEISEVYADRLEHVFFDGMTLRLEFTVTRTEAEAGSGTAPVNERKRWSYTSARIVMSGRAAVGLLNKMHELQALMTRQGLLETRPKGEAETG